MIELLWIFDKFESIANGQINVIVEEFTFPGISDIFDQLPSLLIFQRFF